MKNLNDLRGILGRTMEGVLSGKVTCDQARAVAMVASEVNQSAKLEIDMARATGGDFHGSGFIEVEPNPKQRKFVGNERV